MALFKKKFTLSTKTQLKNSHKRQLVSALKKFYPKVTEEQWAEMFPKKCFVFSKKLNTKVVLYCIKEKDAENEGTPLFFSPTSKNNEPIFPTLEILWRYPNMTTTYVIDTHICKYIFRGADLMLAGMDKDKSEWEQAVKGQPICVKVDGNPFPIGIGYCMKGSDEIKADGFKDRGVGVYHYYTDKLWEEGGSQIPHESFGENQVFPIDGAESNGGDGGKKQKTKKEILWPSLIKIQAKGPNSRKMQGVYKRRAKARVAEKPVYAHTQKDAVIWYCAEDSSWYISDNDSFGTEECWAKCESNADSPDLIGKKGKWYMWDEEDEDYCVGGVRIRKEVPDSWEDEVESSEDEEEPAPEPEVTEVAEETKEVATEVVEETPQAVVEEPFVAATLVIEEDDSMEAQLEKAFVGALNNISDNDLPIQQSDLYQEMKNLNEELDVKQSRFKKLGKFLDAQKQLDRIS